MSHIIVLDSFVRDSPWIDREWLGSFNWTSRNTSKSGYKEELRSLISVLALVNIDAQNLDPFTIIEVSLPVRKRSFEQSVDLQCWWEAQLT